jgi:hypothetical protein
LREPCRPHDTRSMSSTLRNFQDRRPNNPPITNSCAMYEWIVHDIKQISVEENVILMMDFTVKEVFDAISQMRKNKAPVLDRFLA